MDGKMVVMYKRGSMSSTGIRDLRKAGFTVLAVNTEFTDVTFRMAGGIGFEDDLGDMQIMVLKAALQSFNFSDKLGSLVTETLKARVKEAEQKAKANG